MFTLTTVHKFVFFLIKCLIVKKLYTYLEVCSIFFALHNLHAFWIFCIWYVIFHTFLLRKLSKVLHLVCSILYISITETIHKVFHSATDYGRPVRKLPSLHGRKLTPTPKLLGTAEAYFVCHIGPNFQISLIYAFIGCPLSVHSAFNVFPCHLS